MSQPAGDADSVMGGQRPPTFTGIEGSGDRQALLGTILATITEVVFVVDHAGRIVHVNPPSSAVLTNPAESPLGRHASDAVAGAYRSDGRPYAVHDRPFQRVLSTGRPVRGLVVGLRPPDGRPETWHLVNASPLELDPGQPPGVVVTMTDITELKRRENQLRDLAWTDNLTGLPNRARVIWRLGGVDRPPRQECLALLYMDLDGFKAVNDFFGHSLGDRLLVATADRLRQVVGAGEFVARLGGDEFVVIMQGASVDGLRARAEALAREVCAALAAPYEVDGHHLVVSVSIGIAVSDEVADRDREAGGSEGPVRVGEILLQRGDLAMYAAKNAGRDTYRFFEPELDATMRSGVRTVAAIRSGLDNEEFTLHLQPIAAVGGAAPHAAEALLRWTGGGEQIPSAELIRIAEDSGLIVPLGDWVFTEACRLWNQIQPANGPGRTVAVNLSGRQFRRPGMIDKLASTLLDGVCNPALIQVEITESSLMRNLAQSRQRLQALKSLGVTIAIDDFGTGYSSLAHVRELPVDVVKLDRSFLIDVPHDAGSRAIVTAVIAMAHAMGLTVTAEGVENPQQLEFLAEQGCDDYQGYLLGAPSTVEEFQNRWGDAPPAP